LYTAAWYFFTFVILGVLGCYHGFKFVVFIHRAISM
jgi:hypothetical protein